jgi:hypothetical protein
MRKKQKVVRCQRSAEAWARPSERGAAFAEFAVALPVLLLVMLGAVDFGRIGYTATTVAKAAHAGAQYAVKDAVSATNKDEIEKIVRENLEGNGFGSDADLKVKSEQLCLCPPSDEVISCNSGSADRLPVCPSGKLPRMFVDVTVESSFETLFDYPGLPERVNVSRTVSMRAW